MKVREKYQSVRWIGAAREVGAESQDLCGFILTLQQSLIWGALKIVMLMNAGSDAPILQMQVCKLLSENSIIWHTQQQSWIVPAYALFVWPPPLFHLERLSNSECNPELVYSEAHVSVLSEAYLQANVHRSAATGYFTLAFPSSDKKANAESAVHFPFKGTLGYL